jgi:hypothetical protein
MIRFLLAALAAVTVASSADAEVMRTGYFACRSEDVFDRGDEIRISGDREALQQFLLTTMAGGSCAWLKTGTEVTWLAAGNGRGNIWIRPRGQVDRLVTRSDMLAD